MVIPVINKSVSRLGVVRQQLITWTNVDQVIQHHMESTGHNGLILGMLFRYTRYITANHVVGPRGNLWKLALSHMMQKEKSIWIRFRAFYSRLCAKGHYAYFLFAAVIFINSLKWLDVWHGYILTAIFRYQIYFFLYDNGNIDSYVLFVVWLTELV